MSHNSLVMFHNEEKKFNTIRKNVFGFMSRIERFKKQKTDMYITNY